MAREPTTTRPSPVSPPSYDTTDIEAQNETENLCKSCGQACGHTNPPTNASCGYTPQQHVMIYAFSLMIFAILMLLIVPGAAWPMFTLFIIGLGIAAVFYAFPAPWIGTKESPGCCNASYDLGVER